MKKLTGYQMFLLYGCGNPSNRITSRYNDQDSSSSPLTVGTPFLWAAELIVKLDEIDKLYEINIHHIGPWAAIETLNVGSHQRSKLHECVSSVLKGSGRWGCRDEGGHFRLLRDATMRYLRLNSDDANKWDILACHVPIFMNHLKEYALRERYRVNQMKTEEAQS